MLTKQLKSRKAALSKEIDMLESKLSGLPTNEEIFCESAGKYTRWFVKDDNGKKQISKKEKLRAYRLIDAKYYSMLLDEARKEMHHINQYLKFLGKKKPSDRMLEKKSYSSLLKESLDSQDDTLYLQKFRSKSIRVQRWINEPYEKNTKKPEHLTVHTKAGHLVRSKSESIISNCLYEHNIPYRYEARIETRDHIRYPDFTILHPKTLQLYYWEHLGLYEEDGYRRDSFDKLNEYSECGLNFGANLILTAETSKYPLDVNYVELLVKYHFL